MKFSQEEQLIKKTLEQVETPNIENLYEQVNQRRSKSKSFKYNRSFKLVIIFLIQRLLFHKVVI